MMRWIRNGLVVMLLGGSLSGQDFYRCYEYRAEDFAIETPAPWERIITALPRVFPDEEKYPAILLFLDRSGRRMTMDQYLYCRKDANRSDYACGGECDGGHVRMDKQFTLSFDKGDILGVDIEIGSLAQEEERAALELRRGVSRAEARPITCPPYVETLFDPKREDNGGEYAPLLNVCYTSKKQADKEVYFTGCTMQAQPCRAGGREYFGHYPDAWQAYDAYLRCLDGRVKQ